jgi:Plasma-membrane choline transporter
LKRQPASLDFFSEPKQSLNDKNTDCIGRNCLVTTEAMVSAAPYHKVGAGGKAPIIVQGYAMDARPSQGAVSVVHHPKEPSRPQTRQSGCRDVFWALLFYLHLAGVIVLTVLYAPMALQAASEGTNRRLEESNSTNDVDVSSLLPLLGVGSALSVLLSSLALGFMIQFADALIKTALIFNVLSFIFSAVASLFVASILGVVMSSVMAVVAMLYACSVWSRIPFAAANLVTAVTAVRANIGLTFYAFLSIFLLLAWSVLWLVSASSTIFVLGNCDADGVCSNEVSGIAIFLFLVSFYWTIQVITNVVYVHFHKKRCPEGRPLT